LPSHSIHATGKSGNLGEKVNGKELSGPFTLGTETLPDLKRPPTAKSDRCFSTDPPLITSTFYKTTLLSSEAVRRKDCLDSILRIENEIPATLKTLKKFQWWPKPHA
jgi:hypothetical protein